MKDILPDEKRNATDKNSDAERNRSTLGSELYAWRVAAKRADLSALTRLVAICLADYARMDESFALYAHSGNIQVWPRVGRIAGELRANRRTVQRALQALADDGLIDITAMRGGRSSDTNLYRLLPQADVPTVGGGQATAPRGGRRVRRGAVRATAKGRSGDRPNISERSSEEKRARAGGSPGASPSRAAPTTRAKGKRRRRAPAEWEDMVSQRLEEEPEAQFDDDEEDEEQDVYDQLKAGIDAVPDEDEFRRRVAEARASREIDENDPSSLLRRYGKRWDGSEPDPAVLEERRVWLTELREKHREPEDDDYEEED